jgi:hypothetical protein
MSTTSGCPTRSVHDPAVIGAIEEFGWFARNDDFVAGGSGNVATTDFRDSPKGLFSSPPQCYMHRQASFIPAFFPEGTEVGEDATSSTSRPMPKGSRQAGSRRRHALGDHQGQPRRACADRVPQSPIAHEVWMAQKGFLTPLQGVNTGCLRRSDAQAKMNDILLGATTFRFDGSDLMPGGVGAGSFWTGMVDYTGGKPPEEVADGNPEVLGCAEVSRRPLPTSAIPADRSSGIAIRKCLLGREGMHPALQGLITIIVGVGGCVGYFYFSNQFLDKVLFPARGKNAGATSTAPTMIRPWLFLFPAMFALGLYLAYPVFETLRLSLTDRDAGGAFVGSPITSRWPASRNSGKP